MEGGARTRRSDKEEDTPQDCIYVGRGTGDRGGTLATQSDDPGTQGRGGIGCAGLLGAAGSLSPSDGHHMKVHMSTRCSRVCPMSPRPRGP